jgi:hypothetical protein
VDLVLELLKSWGPTAVVSIVLWVMLQKSETREAKKDIRIQMLENQLIESYDERISAADRIAGAIHDSATASNNAAKALENLALETRSNKSNG